MEGYGDVFHTLVSLPGELHLEVHKKIRPVQHVPWKVPVTMKEEKMKKIDELIEQKIVAKVNRTNLLDKHHDCHQETTK